MTDLNMKQVYYVQHTIAGKYPHIMAITQTKEKAEKFIAKIKEENSDLADELKIIDCYIDNDLFFDIDDKCKITDNRIDYCLALYDGTL